MASQEASGIRREGCIGRERYIGAELDVPYVDLHATDPEAGSCRAYAYGRAAS
jgi:hypothetical protein